MATLCYSSHCTHEMLNICFRAIRQTANDVGIAYLISKISGQSSAASGRRCVSRSETQAALLYRQESIWFWLCTVHS